MADSPEEELVESAEEAPDSENQDPKSSRSGIPAILQKVVPIIKSSVMKALHPNNRKTTGSIIGGIILLLAVYFLFIRSGASSEELLKESLKTLAEDETVEGRLEVEEVAKSLLDKNVRPSNFLGGAEYLLGIVSFRNAMDSPKGERETGLKRAVRYLKEARNQGVPLKNISELSYAMGISLFDIGSSLDSREYLEKVILAYSEGKAEEELQYYPAAKVEVGLRLIDVYLDQPTPKSLGQSLELCDSLLTTVDLAQQHQQQLLLQKSQIHLNLQQNTEAENALKSMKDFNTENRALQIFQARTLMSQGASWMSGKQIRSGIPLSSLIYRAHGVNIFERAINLLRPIANDRFDPNSARQASYLMGLAAEKLADDREQERDSIRYDEAINYYLRIAKRYSGSHEGIAANLKVANLLRISKRDEEAILEFQKALRSLTGDDTFRNRWLSKSDFENAVVSAWQQWIDNHRFENAIELARSMYPLISKQRALEFEAIARQRWAELISSSLPTTPFQERAAKKKELIEKWKQSGEAYSTLANSMATTNRYRDMLWISSVHYRQGHDFEKALKQNTKFINSNPKRRYPLALVTRGEVLIDLDRIDEAIEHFQKVTSTYRTDPAYFKAMYLLGICYKEKNEPEKTETIWRNLLTSPLLEPTAQEWKNTLFSLGQFVFNRTSSKQAFLNLETQQNEPELYETNMLTLHRRWNDTVQQLEEFLDRYPGDSRQNEARFMLAKSLHHSTKYLKFKFSQAETANRRQELEREIVNNLIQARNAYRSLQKSLQFSKDQKFFSREEQLYLKDCYFNFAHTLYDLAAFNSEYEKAMIAYSGAVNMYPQDPRVLLSYLQIADCNLKLSKPAEARSMLVQARVILRQFPKSVFESPNTNFSRKDWESWIDLFLKFNLDSPRPSNLKSTVNRIP